jgi:hypothetical protein
MGKMRYGHAGLWHGAGAREDEGSGSRVERPPRVMIDSPGGAVAGVPPEPARYPLGSLPDRTACRKMRDVPLPTEEEMEFANFVLMFIAAWLLWRRPEKERLAFRLLLVSVVLMIVLFSIATRSALLPGFNY